MLAEQDGRCAICREVFDDNPRHRHVDHDHETSRVRGLLCHRCNTMLGLARDSSVVLATAIAYLERA